MLDLPSRSAGARPSSLHRTLQRGSGIRVRGHLQRGSGIRVRGPLQAGLALGCLVLSVLGGVGACGEGEKCVGGVMVNGVCEGKCDPSKCLEGNTCVGNRCVLTCDAHADCYAGTQDCAPAKEDTTGADIYVCTSNDKDVGFGQGCPFGTECGTFGLCPNGKSCSVVECGRQPTDPDFCAPDAEACGSDPSCTIGKCSNNGAPCTVSACAATECDASFRCFGSGPGDADAYCTRDGCTTNEDCPGGYECGITRDRRELCGTNKGNSNFCGGATSDPCVELDQLESMGLMEGSLCILKNTCIKRSQCAPCETDLDCSLREGQLCVSIGGSMRCAQSCAVDGDCEPDALCDAGSCKPRFGACEGQGNFCEPCRNDNDCGGPGTTKGCGELSGGQHACFDYAFPDTCTTDADCPTSPGGKHGLCLDANYVDPADPVYLHCYFPYDAVDNKFGCW